MKQILVGFAIMGLAFAVALKAPAWAQQMVYSNPVPSTTLGGDVSGTIAVTNTFQRLWSAANGTYAPVASAAGSRRGCSVQNNSTHSMYVNEGTAVASATTTNTWVVAPNGGLFNCNFNGVVLTGEIDITGTAGDAFVAKQF